MKTFPHDSIEMIELTEIEELILFMLIADYSQQEIAQTLKCSRKQVVEIISESLCVKFELPILSTALLIDKAIAKGYNMVIPRLFFNYSLDKESAVLIDVTESPIERPQKKAAQLLFRKEKAAHIENTSNCE